MANILTNLRELSVAFPFCSDITMEQLTPEIFQNICNNNIQNFNSKVNKISKENKNFSPSELDIIKNGFSLGYSLKTILKLSNKNNKIIWLGNDKDDLIDLKINDYLISLKENSNILRNIGLYQLLNYISNTNKFERGVNVFKYFASEDLNNWFHSSIISLKKIPPFIYESEKGYKASAWFEEDTLFLKFNEEKEIIKNISNLSYEDFEKLTTAKIREKCFSKWLKYIPKNDFYYEAKMRCAKNAGNNLLNFINKNLVPTSSSVLNFFNLESFNYIYAKNDGKETKIFEVPSINEIDYNNYIIEDIKVDIPNSQLNLKTKIKNIKTGIYCILRNEIRYSHGQLNGTPEAKLYYDSGDGLEKLIYKKLQ